MSKLLSPGTKGPYRIKNPKTPYEERLARRRAPRPECKCGCGHLTSWLVAKARWRVYVEGHYRAAHPYKDEVWLRAEYCDKRRTLQEIADECGVVRSSVRRFLHRFGIEPRDRSESRVGRAVGPKNPAWRGGVAEWDYAAGWKSIARKIRDLDKWTCQICHERRPRWGKNLHVHHIDGDKLNNDPLNLISVCASCHPRGAKEHKFAPTLRAITAQREGVI